MPESMVGLVDLRQLASTLVGCILLVAAGSIGMGLLAGMS